MPLEVKINFLEYHKKYINTVRASFSASLGLRADTYIRAIPGTLRYSMDKEGSVSVLEALLIDQNK